jgi:integrase
MAKFICPFCESEGIKKNGLRNGLQYFRCKDCGKHIPESCKIGRSKLIRPFIFEDNVWDLRALIPDLDDRDKQEGDVIIDFGLIRLNWLKEVLKKYIRQEAFSGSSVSTLYKEFSQLKRLSAYLANQQNIRSVNEIHRYTILNFVGLSCKNKSNGTVSKILGNLKKFFTAGNIHGWFTVPENLILPEDYPKYQRGTPNDIPSVVLEQIEDNLHKLPDPIARMWIVGYFCAMRLSELQLCNLDCLKQDSRGEWAITFWRKKNKDWHTLPITRDVAQVIQQQQDYIKQQFGDRFNYLFCDYLSVARKVPKASLEKLNLPAVSRVASNELLITFINHLITSEDIRDENGELWHFKTHQLRDTRLTHLFETGHEFALVSKWAGHKKWENTQKYVHVKDHTLRNETVKIQTKLANIKGEAISEDSLPETLQKTPNAHTLAVPGDHINTPIYGYCGLPLDEECLHWKACYTCPSFVARREQLPNYIRIRDELRAKQARAEQNGETARVDQFKQQADSLDAVIARFEEAVA